jgi:hypothetical protein
MPVLLILVNEIVHLPELTLKPGSLAALAAATAC